jgi:nitroreductase
VLIAPIARRRSPRAFDAAHELSTDDLGTLLEAARWAPSAMNRQPWAFLVGHRGDPTFKGIADTLSGNNQLWAPVASALLVAMVRHDGAAERTSAGRAYELGLAVGQLGVQAEAMGLVTHQMGGFDAAQLRAEFAIPEHLHPVVAIAVGASGDPAQLPATLRARETAQRARQPQTDWVFTEAWA